jgi:hypothetical protein
MIFDPMSGAQNEADARMAAELVDWLVANVKLPRHNIKELNDAKAATFSRLGL